MAKRKTKKQKTVEERFNPFDAGDDTPLKQGSGLKRTLKAEDDDMDLHSEIDRNVRIAVSAMKGWAEDAREDIAFSLGDQWDAQDKAKLAEEHRPCMTFNKIKPMINLVTGHLIQNQARIEVKPEGGEDINFSDTFDRLLDHIDKVSNLQFKLNYMFTGGERAGRSWIEFYMDYDEDPIFGKLKVNYLGPFKVFIDPNCTEYDLSDAEYAFKVIKLSKGKWKKLYPDKQDDIDDIGEDSISNLITEIPGTIEGDANNYGLDKNVSQTGLTTSGGEEEPTGDLKQLTGIEYWKRDYVDKWYCYFPEDGSTAEYDTEEEAMAEVKARSDIRARNAADIVIKAGIKAQPDENFQVRHILRKRRVCRMQFAVKVGDMILTDKLVDSPFEPFYHGFPFFQYIAEWAPEAEDENLKVMGLVRALKDPQREVNKSRSQYLHILNTSANSGWQGDEDALSPAGWTELRQFGGSPGIMVRQKPGSRLERIHPVEPSLAQNVREKAATDDFKEVSGINADLLAVDTKGAPSGKAIALRIRQAITILQPSFANFRFTKQLIGEFLFRIVPSMFDEVKVGKVLGPMFLAERGIDINQIRIYLKSIEDGKYNVTISEQGVADTLRQETLEDLMQMAQSGMALPPDVIIQFMNIPNKAEVIKKITEYQDQQAQREAAIEMAKKGGGQQPTAAPPTPIR